jgi:hypothetical protein
MVMWILAIVLVVLCVVIGWRQGATRAAFTFIGLIAAACLAVPLTPAFAWIFPMIGFKNKLVSDFGAPIVAFLVVSLVFKALGQFVHRKIDYHFRYNRQDAERAVWEVMHRRVGACVGVLNAAVYLVVFSIIISVFGYYTVQTGAGENNSKVLSFLGKAGEDLQATKMDRVVAPFNPATEKYFDGSDIAGLLFHNRNLVDRLYNYPVFAAMSEQPAYKDLGKDKELQNQIRGNASLNEILKHPKVAEVVSNSDVAQRVMELDFKDLKNYLETGESPKYSAEKILGRWAYNESATLQLNKKMNPEVSAQVWFRMKNELTERFDNSVFTAFYDNTTKFVLATNREGRSSPMRAIPLPPNAPRGARTNFVALWMNTNALYSATGKWSGKEPNYLVTLGNQRNGTATSEGKLNGDQLSFQFAGAALSFRKLPD